MKPGVFSLSSALLMAFFAAPLLARADANPDFDDDAKPILKMQPGLLQYVESRFEVKDTGTAKYPGDDDRRPAPPFIFRARALGSNGPYNLRLLIQPGPAGHILGVVDMNKVRLTQPGYPPSEPSMANQPPPQEPPPSSGAPAQPNPAVQVPELTEPPVTQQEPAQAQPQAPAQQPAPQQPNEPSSDTPSGPIMDSGSPPPATTGQPSLSPPPDPAPPAQ